MNPDVVRKHKVRVQTLQSMLGCQHRGPQQSLVLCWECVPRKTPTCLMSLSQHENKKTNCLQARSKTKMSSIKQMNLILCFRESRLQLLIECCSFRAFGVRPPAGGAESLSVTFPAGTYFSAVGGFHRCTWDACLDGNTVSGSCCKFSAWHSSHAFSWQRCFCEE